MKFLRVTAPYVTLKIRDANGVWTLQGKYKGAVLPVDDVEPESLAHHVETDLAEVFSAAAENGEPKPGSPQDPEPEPEPVKAEEPKKAAPAKKTAA